MKNIYTALLILFSLAILSPNTVFAQCDSTAFYANKYMSAEFLSDGQSYRALLYDDQMAEFNTTFYGGAKYRIIAYSGLEAEQLVFTLSDKNNTVLFSSARQNNTAYWDFEFENTMECKIEAQLDLSKLNSGCAVILIGFEK